MDKNESIYITPEEWQELLLQSQCNCIINPIVAPQWATNQSPDLVDQGSKEVTLPFSHSWTTQEGLEELGKPKP